MAFVPAPILISASRRTDIPAFFADWFAASLDRGIARYRNPYSGTWVEVPLRRDQVAGFVFWTRDPRPFFPVLRRLERRGYPSLFHVTVTGLGARLEPRAPDTESAVLALRALSSIVGPRRVLWRFDPLLPGEDPAAAAERFETLAASLSGRAARCIVSLAVPYRKSLRATRGIRGVWGDAKRLREAAGRILETGRRHGFDVRSCCSPLLAQWGIPPAACADGELLRRLYPGAPIPAERSPSRSGCLCFASRDIGTYHTCRHGCLYCYAA